ncbi:DNA polymerase/3'-5' exonuclease PolX [Staphylospora marina]|uniref:DNA polymerase/3'-5' exonuclease PolX n=1 Tax=Staphylospora marina TaxID=2490858 RepID=UPI0019D2F1C6|nr:DNA polymerase/3'-5' exonuclease PolX [Staphylospora marina]
MNNPGIAGMLHQLADYLEIEGENPFRVNAWRRAARAVENSRIPVVDMLDRLENLPGVGKGTAAVIREMATTGTAQVLEDLKRRIPPGLPVLLGIPGLGPKSLHLLHRELGISDLRDLVQAAEEGKIRNLPGFGVKKEQKLLEAIRKLGSRPNRRLLAEARQLADVVLRKLAGHPAVVRIEPAGSLRRGKETVKDLDFVVATEHPKEAGEAILAVSEVKEVTAKGDTKITVELEADGIRMSADFRLVAPEKFASAWLHFTGSAAHNVRIRQRAKELGWKVSEYGISDDRSGEERTFASEEAFYRALGLPYIEPELREDQGEFEAAEQNGLPDLIRPDDVRGDLHMHTVWSDGAETVYEMAVAARERGYEYIAVTDHSRSLRVAYGLSVDELMKQWEEIDRVNRELEGITVLKGAEVDILADGSLDYPDEILERLDVVIASVHSRLGLDEETMTDRILRAIKHPYVHIIGHPTGRLLGRRDPCKLDLDRLFRTAADTGTILELNADPRRLDLGDQLLRRACEEYGTLFVISSDAHSSAGLDRMAYGVITARRAWLEKRNVLNTLPLAELRKRLRKGRP